jgi:hypothetical protein
MAVGVGDGAEAAGATVVVAPVAGLGAGAEAQPASTVKRASRLRCGVSFIETE